MKRSRSPWLSWPILFVAILCAAAVAVKSCSIPDRNFSQYEGFREHFIAYPPKSDLPNAQELALLKRHRPKLFLPVGHEGPIGFYADYVAHGVLRDGKGQLISDTVTRAILNKHKDDPGAVFTHKPGGSNPTTPVMLGRIDRVSLEASDGGQAELKVLTYHAVFRSSGLVAGLGSVKAGVLSVLADLNDWHQLDHYTAASVVLGPDDAPIALMVQQHNYIHTYLVGESIEPADDGRLAVDVAIRSNELYPHRQGRVVHPAVRFLDPDSFRYMLGVTDRPFLAAEDVTDPEREVEYILKFLPPDDAFYTFKGFLGERRGLPGRDGPPGADYNTLPALKPLSSQIVMGYWRRGNKGDIARFEASYGNGGNLLSFVAGQAPVLVHNIECLRKAKSGCELR